MRPQAALNSGQPAPRNAAIDSLRTVVTLLVVLHHSILAYAAFGYFDRRHYLWSTAPVVDPQRWAGFDLIVLFNDGWFMVAMFALSGLFVRQGIARHGAAGYLRRRAIRLGLPFLAAVLVLMPFAYYPSFHLTGSPLSLWQFWYRSVMEGPWPGGPAWFLWVLLVFDCVAAMVVRPHAAALGRNPWSFLASNVIFAAAGTTLLSLLFGLNFWFSAGPFAVQMSRIVLYATAFRLGVAAGPHVAVRLRWEWPACCVLLFAGVMLRSDGTVYRTVLYSLDLAAFSFVMGSVALAFAQRFLVRPPRWLAAISRDAFAIYVIHYIPVVWLQYALLNAMMPAIAKATIVFLGSLGLSWAAAAALRRVWNGFAGSPGRSAHP